MQMLPNHKSIKRVWHRSPGGILLSDGHASDMSRVGSESYLEMKIKALKLEELFQEEGVTINRTCDLAALISDAKSLSDEWLINGAESLPLDTLFRVAQLNRIAEAALMLKGTREAKSYLRKLTTGSLNLLGREQSVAKNFLWELELLGMLKATGIQAELKEPPDIVATVDSIKFGIACKKVYSERGVEKALSTGVKQIRKKYRYGILAINIDDLAPANEILSVKSQPEMANVLSRRNMKFLESHQRHMRKYFASERITAVLVSSAALSDVNSARVRLNNARQASVWAPESMSRDHWAAFSKFYQRIMR